MAHTPHKHDDEPPVPAKVAPTLDPNAPQPTIGVKGEPIEDGERDPDTIAEEQRRRSAEIEAVGPAAYMEAHSTAPVEEPTPKQVAGVAPKHEPEPEHRGRR